MANVIITGCSRGIGYELARLFAQSGHKVLALSRNDKPITELNESNITAFPFDICDDKDLEKVEHFLE